MISATTSVGMPARFRSAATRDSLPPGSSGSRAPSKTGAAYTVTVTRPGRMTWAPKMTRAPTVRDSPNSWAMISRLPRPFCTETISPWGASLPLSPAAGFLGGKGFDTEQDDLIGLIGLGFEGRGADGTDPKIPPNAVNLQPFNPGLGKMLAPAQVGHRLAGVLQETTKDRAQGPGPHDEITHRRRFQFSVK